MMPSVDGLCGRLLGAFLRYSVSSQIIKSSQKVVKTENEQKETAWLNLENGLTMRFLLGPSSGT